MVWGGYNVSGALDGCDDQPQGTVGRGRASWVSSALNHAQNLFNPAHEPDDQIPGLHYDNDTSGSSSHGSDSSDASSLDSYDMVEGSANSCSSISSSVWEPPDSSVLSISSDRGSVYINNEVDLGVPSNVFNVISDYEYVDVQLSSLTPVMEDVHRLPTDNLPSPPPLRPKRHRRSQHRLNNLQCEINENSSISGHSNQEHGHESFSALCQSNHSLYGSIRHSFGSAGPHCCTRHSQSVKCLCHGFTEPDHGDDDITYGSSGTRKWRLDCPSWGVVCGSWMAGWREMFPSSSFCWEAWWWRARCQIASSSCASACHRASTSRPSSINKMPSWACKSVKQIVTAAPDFSIKLPKVDMKCPKLSVFRPKTSVNLKKPSLHISPPPDRTWHRFNFPKVPSDFPSSISFPNVRPLIGAGPVMWHVILYDRLLYQPPIALKRRLQRLRRRLADQTFRYNHTALID